MKQTPRRIVAAVLIAAYAGFGIGCAYWPQIQTLATQFSAFVSNPNNAALEASIVSGIASITSQKGFSAATAYSDASAIAIVEQAYVGSGSAPASVVSASTQIGALGSAAAKALSAVPATQTLATKLFDIAAKLNPAAPATSGTSAALDPTNQASKSMTLRPGLCGDWRLVAESKDQPNF